MTQRFRAGVAYNGAPFHGFARNDGVRTVAGDLEAALTRVTGEQVTLTCAGRTDKGVHARGQVVSFDLPVDTDVARVERAVNGLCGPEIALHDLVAVEDDFDARRSATGRMYRYRVHEGAVHDPLRHAHVWHVPGPLAHDAMNEAAASLVGEHDFSSFCRRPKSDVEVSLVRTVESASWRRVADEAHFTVVASAFCHQMVRSIVGTLVDVGLGRLDVAAMPGILAARDRSVAGQIAPPHGLVLWAVRYPSTS